MKYGVNSLNNQNNLIFNTTGKEPQIKAVRVLSIILDETHPRFKELGEWNALGFIEYEDIINPLKTSTPSISKPLNPNFKNYPLINEIVYILYLPDTSINNFTSGNFSYYINNVSIWNHPHHNGYPSNPNTLPPEQQKDYIQTTGGDIRKITDESTEINLGKTFKERSNIHPLLPFEGDIINEGRFGNSIRLGSTVKNTKNNWSSNGNNGDPIIIIRNGQGIQNEEGWIPITENINNDNSSIYLSSNQIISLNISPIYNSYLNAPISPKEYTNPQIIINSERLVLNSSKDHLLLNSNKTINLNSQEGINIDTQQNFTINAKKTFIGNKDATEPILLGNQTVLLLSSLINNLKSFMEICSNLVSSPAGSPIPQLNVVSTQMSSILTELSNKLDSIKSKNNYTI